MQIILNHDGIGQTTYNFPPFKYYCIIFHSANSQQLRLRSSSAAADQWTKSDASDRCWNASKLKNLPNLRQSFRSPNDFNDFKAFVTTSRTSKYSPALTRGKSRGQWDNILHCSLYVLTSLSRSKEEVTSDIIFAVFSKASFAYSIYVHVLLMLVK